MASISKLHDLEILSLIRYISVMPFSNITFLFRCRIDGWKSAIVYRCRSGTVLYVIDGGGRVKNVTRTAFTRRPRGEKKWRKNPRARETGVCAYNQSGIISGDLFGINLAFVARIPANNPLSDGTKQRGKKIWNESWQSYFRGGRKKSSISMREFVDIELQFNLQKEIVSAVDYFTKSNST